MSWVLIVLLGVEVSQGSGTIPNKGGVLELNTYDTTGSCEAAASTSNRLISEKSARDELIWPIVYLCIPKPV